MPGLVALMRPRLEVTLAGSGNVCFVDDRTTGFGWMRKWPLATQALKFVYVVLGLCTVWACANNIDPVAAFVTHDFSH